MYCCCMEFLTMLLWFMTSLIGIHQHRIVCTCVCSRSFLQACWLGQFGGIGKWEWRLSRCSWIWKIVSAGASWFCGINYNSCLKWEKYFVLRDVTCIFFLVSLDTLDPLLCILMPTTHAVRILLPILPSQ